MNVTKYQLPSFFLIVIGLYIALDRLLSYYTNYIADSPSHRLGLLAEFVLIGFLIAAGVLVAIGMIGLRRDRPIIPLVFLVGVVALWGTFVVDLYSISANTQFVVALGLTVSIIPAIATYLAYRHWV